MTRLFQAKNYHAFLTLLAGIALFGSSCHNNRHKTYISTSVDSLKLCVDFQIKIKSVTWELDKRNNENGIIPGPDDYNLCAEILCDSSDCSTFKTKLLKANTDLVNPNIFLDTSFVKSWFSKDIKQIFYRDGDYLKTKVPTYNLTKYIVGKTSYNDGYFCFIGFNKILLVLDK